jgi:hypothetical protein
MRSEVVAVGCLLPSAFRLLPSAFRLPPSAFRLPLLHSLTSDL